MVECRLVAWMQALRIKNISWDTKRYSKQLLHLFGATLWSVSARCRSSDVASRRRAPRSPRHSRARSPAQSQLHAPVIARTNGRDVVVKRGFELFLSRGSGVPRQTCGTSRTVRARCAMRRSRCDADACDGGACVRAREREGARTLGCARLVWMMMTLRGERIVD
jgi:hypothetical protein